MLFLCNEETLHLLNCYYIKPDEVQLNQKLLKLKNTYRNKL